MEKKTKNSAAGLIVVLAVAVVNLLTKAGRPGLLISLLYIFILVVLFYAIFRIFSRRSRNSKGNSSRPERGVSSGAGNPSSPYFEESGVPKERRSPRNRREPRDRNRRTANEDRVEREEERSAAACGENLSFRDAEQWKSLYESGLIDRDEYREKLNETERRA